MSAIIPQNISYLLKLILHEPLESYSITAQQNQKGEGFMGDMFFVIIKDKVSGKASNYVIKQAFADDKLRTIHPVRNSYVREIYFYTEVWPKLNALQWDLFPTNLFNKVPRCFGTSSKEKAEAIVLENLREQGFRTYDKKIPLDKEHYELIFTQYGRFHALSYAYKVLRPREYEKLSKTLTHLLRTLCERKHFTDFLSHVFKIPLKCLDPIADSDILRKYRPYIEKAGEIFGRSCDYKGDYSVIIHGDCWSNNMMFKYDQSNKLCDMRLLDFQTACVGTPVNDLAYCLYSGGTKEIFDNLDYYLKVYHDNFLRTLEEFGVDLKKAYRLEELKRDWGRYCKMGFIFSIIVWRVKFTNEEDVVDFTDITDNSDGFPEQMYSGKFDEEAFLTKSREIIMHMYENDFL